MKLLDWLGNIFSTKEADASGKKTISVKESCNNLSIMNLEAFYFLVGVSMISGTISKCEIKTFLNNKNVKGDEYYLLNYEPNINQNSSQFLQQLVETLLYEQEALVIEIGGQLLIADSFYQEEYAIVENTFKNVTVKNLQFNKPFKMSEVLYFKLQNPQIRSYLLDFGNRYSELIADAIDTYKTAGGEKGTLEIDSMASGNENFEDELEDLMNNKFSKFFNAKKAVLPLMDGYKYTPADKKETKASQIDDIKKIEDKIVDRVGQALKIPPVLLKGEVANIKEATNNYLSFCIDPLKVLIEDEYGRKRYGKQALDGSYIMIDTTMCNHVDIFDVANSIDKLISDRVLNTNEIRNKLGESPINEKWANEYVMTKNLGSVEPVKGGE